MTSISPSLSRSLSRSLAPGMGGEIPLTIPQILASVRSSWKAWWTTFDPTLPTDPGIAKTDLGGGSFVVDSWTDQIGGFVASPAGAGNRPAYAADGSNFGGRSCVQFAISGNKELQYNNAGAPIMAATVFPHIVLVGRLRAALPTVAAHRFYEAANGATTLNRFTDLVVLNQIYQPVVGNGLGVPFGNNSISGSQFIASSSNSAVGGRSSRRIDGVTTLNTEANSTVATSAAMTTFTLGGRRVLGTVPSDLNTVEWLLFDQPLPLTVEALLLDALRAKHRMT